MIPLKVAATLVKLAITDDEDLAIGVGLATGDQVD